MSTVPRALLLSAALTLVPVGVGVAVADDPTRVREPAAYDGATLAQFDAAATVVQRAPFCELVDDAAVTEALGGAGDLTAYANGEESDAVPGGDVAHEYGCRYTPDAAAGASGEARAWVFAPPVTAERAATLAAADPPAGCTPLGDSPAFGAPSLALLCTGKSTRTVTHRGLFGDAWFSCSLSLPAAVAEAELTERAGAWCVATARAASVPIT